MEAKKLNQTPIVVTFQNFLFLFSFYLLSVFLGNQTGALLGRRKCVKKKNEEKNGNLREKLMGF